MHRSFVKRIRLLMVVAIVAACTGAVSPPQTSSPTTGPAAPIYHLRATLFHAIPPLNRFAWLPIVAITGDLDVVVAGPMLAIYPGPLLPNLQAQPLTTNGFAEIVSRARELGLLSGARDFTPPDVVVGAPLGRIELLVDGVFHDLTGDPSRVIVCVTTPCVPAPGTPEAFATFWQALVDMSWLDADLGEQAQYAAESFAILVGVEPVEEPTLPPQVVAWPLGTRLEAFGTPVGNEPRPRCGTVRGADSATLLPVLTAANVLTRWVDEGGGPDDDVAIVVRPMVPGEDVCRELFGLAD